MSNYLVDGMRDKNLVGLRIRDNEHIQDMVVGINFRRRDQLKTDAVWGVLGKVSLKQYLA